MTPPETQNASATRKVALGLKANWEPFALLDVIDSAVGGVVGPKLRGFAVGLNEFAGYVAVGATAFLTGYLASLYGLRPVPIYLGIGYALSGALLSILLVRDTRDHVRLEARTSRAAVASI